MLNIKEYRDEWFDFVGYKPHAGQMKLHNPPNGIYDYYENPDGTRFIVASCGRRFGKSYAAAREIELMLCKPNTVSWIVAPTYDTSEKIFNFVYKELVLTKGYKPSKFSQKHQTLAFDWGGGQSILQGRSAEHPSGLIGEGVDLVVFDEASKIGQFKRIWEMYVRPTLSDKKGRAIFISTPDGHNHFYKLFLQGQNGSPGWFSYNSPSWENKYAFPLGINDPDLIEAKNTSSIEIFNQEYGAEFTSLQGRVYNDFTRNENVGWFPYNHRLPTFLTIDFGYRQPAVLWFQTATINGVEHIYIIDEISHQTNLKTSELVDMIKQRQYQIAGVYGDPAGYQTQASVGVGEADIFHQMTGFRMMALRDKASRSIASGVSHVRNFILNANGERRLHVDKSCAGIIEDFEGYAYPDTKDGHDKKELPLKDGYYDHGMDAIRYGIVNCFPIRNYKIKYGVR